MMVPKVQPSLGNRRRSRRKETRPLPVIRRGESRAHFHDSIRHTVVGAAASHTGVVDEAPVAGARANTEGDARNVQALGGSREKH